MESNRQEKGSRDGTLESAKVDTSHIEPETALVHLDEHGHVLTDVSFLEKLLNWDAMVRELSALKPFW